MRQVIVTFLLVLSMAGCKSRQRVLSEAKATERLPAKEIIEQHYATQRDFTTLYIKANARYRDDRQSQNVTSEIRMKRDEKILVSVRFLGITMAKALITPSRVQYYSKPNAEYFDGDYSALSRWLGTELDFKKVQNLLIGEALDDLSKGSYKSSIEDKLYKLESSSGKTNKAFYFEGGRFLVKRQEVNQPSLSRMLRVLYPSHTPHSKGVLPSALQIEAMQEKGKVNINIDYSSVTFSEELSFPYSVPDGYDRVIID
jgi:hypothetical protein